MSRPYGVPQDRAFSERYGVSPTTARSLGGLLDVLAGELYGLTMPIGEARGAAWVLARIRRIQQAARSV